MSKKRRKSRKVFKRMLKDNPLFLDFVYSPLDYYGGERDFCAAFDPNTNAIVIFPRAFSNDDPDDLPDLIVTVINHEAIHQALRHLLTPKERRKLRLRGGEEQLVCEVENDSIS